ncbi:MAG: penicillin-binding protein [Treponema sp.]|nr:MAG: penicillin-binding protein [Treponema sp.]
MGLKNFSDRISDNWVTILVTSLIMFFVVAATAIIVFFVALQPADQVMVPNIVGKDLNSAVIELQAKELNTRLQLRYSDDPNDEGLVLEQKPGPGAIVKAGRKVEIIVSNGTVMNSIANYIGKNVEEVKQDLSILFTSGSKHLVVVQEPHMYRFNNAPPGTILEQNPPPETELHGKTTISFVVSKGPKREVIAIPELKGMALNKVYATMANTKLIFNFSLEESAEYEKATVVSQSEPEGTSLQAYSKVAVKIGVPKRNNKKLIYGVYSIDLPVYPYPLDISLDMVSPNGDRSQLVICKHPGGRFSVPYGVEKGSILVLTVLGKEVETTEVGE